MLLDTIPTYPKKHSPIEAGKLLTPYLQSRGFTEGSLISLLKESRLKQSLMGVTMLTNICEEMDRKYGQIRLTREECEMVAGGKAGDRRGLLVNAAELDMEETTWLWTHHIPAGEVSLLAGYEGLGKSSIGFALIAQITNGQMEGVHKGQPKRVIVCATEDSREKTIIPRLVAAGADRSQVDFFTVKSGGVDESPSFPGDIPLLRQVADDPDVAMIYFDPLTSRIGDKIDSHKDAETRRALEPLADIAHETDTAILGLIHKNKSGSTNILNAVMGSKAFTSVARAVLVCMDDPDDEGKASRLFGIAKSNLGPDSIPAHRYQIEPAMIPGARGIQTSRVAWKTRAERSIKSIHADAVKPQGRAQRDEIADFIRDYLAGGPKPSADLNAAGKARGFNDRTFQEVRRKLGVKATKTADGWQASLPAGGE